MPVCRWWCLGSRGKGSGLLIRKGATSGLIDLDQIRIGETWDAVVIPEPSTYTALIGLLALGLVAWRRRR